MNLSKLFKIAHRVTKAAIKAGDNYRVTFAAALKLARAAYFGKYNAKISIWSKKEVRFYINNNNDWRGGMADAGYLTMKDGVVDYSNIATEYQLRLKNALEALAIIHNAAIKTVLAMQLIKF